jgi:hypothetical protein
MSALSNHKHELFAQELAKGASKLDAHRRAGYSGCRSAASRLSTNENIRSRVVELQAIGSLSTVVTIERLTAELEEARRVAIARGNASAAVLAIVAKAKLHGLMNRDQAGAMGDKVVDAPERQRTPRELARMIAFSLAMGQRQLISGPGSTPWRAEPESL